jgi:hypothetical protein
MKRHTDPWDHSDPKAHKRADANLKKALRDYDESRRCVAQHPVTTRTSSPEDIEELFTPNEDTPYAPIPFTAPFTAWGRSGFIQAFLWLVTSIFLSILFIGITKMVLGG